MAETRLSVHVYDRQYETVKFLSYGYRSAEKFGGLYDSYTTDSE